MAKYESQCFVYYGPGNVRAETRMISCGPTDIVVKIDVCGRCGTDKRLYTRPHSRVKTPTVLGHELVGRVVEVGVDGKIRFFTTDGALEKIVDLYAMHREFNRSYGRKNTRHPAGGFTMPYAAGLWRPAADGRRKMVIARYGNLSFLDEEQEFEGLLATGGYTNSRLLPSGVDFDGDGAEEQLALNCNKVFAVGGSGRPVVHDPHGDHFFPQVYSAQGCLEPDGEFKIDGARPYRFHRIAWGNGMQYVLIVRESYLGIYDGANNRFAFSWTPNVKFSAAAAMEDSADTLRVLAQTRDDLLWEVTWRGGLDRVAGFRTLPLDDRIERIISYPAKSGAAILAGRDGLYLMPEWGTLHRIVRGDFQDVCVIDKVDMIAATRDGRVIRYARRP